VKRWLGPADALLQQAAWWVVVLGAASGRALLAAGAGAAVVGLHLALRPGERRRVAAAAAAAGAFGFVTDSLLAVAGLLAFGGAVASPPWMVGLWGAFGVALTASLRAPAAWSSPRLAALAALSGPLAYRAGAALGAIDLPVGSAALLAVAAQWAVGVPALAWIAREATPVRGPAAGGGGPATAGASRGGWRWAR
jgi:hypothetical protein